MAKGRSGYKSNPPRDPIRAQSLCVLLPIQCSWCGGHGRACGRAGLCWGLPLEGSTHNKNLQCLVDPEAQSQALGSHGRDSVVAEIKNMSHS